MKNNFLLITSSTSSIAVELINSFTEPKNLILHARNEVELDRLVSNLPAHHHIIKWIYDFEDITDLGQDLKQLITDNTITINEFVNFSGVLSLGAVRTFSLSKSQNIFNVNFFSALEIIRVQFLKQTANLLRTSYLFLLYRVCLEKKEIRFMLQAKVL